MMQKVNSEEKDSENNANGGIYTAKTILIRIQKSYFYHTGPRILGFPYSPNSFIYSNRLLLYQSYLIK